MSNLPTSVNILIFVFMIFLFSCNDFGLVPDCLDCIKDEPVTTKLRFNLYPEYKVGITIKLYEGNLEDSLLYNTFTFITESFDYEVNVNQKYAVTATYIIGNDKYVATNSALPRVKYSGVRCNNPCYIVYDNIVDLRLKYTKP
jgi:hypothetical protein